MAWEKRGRYLYYYRKIRIGERVLSQYIGRGPIAESISELDKIFRRKRRSKILKNRNSQNLKETKDRSLKLTLDGLQIILSALLISKGFHKHKGQWRRIRGRDYEV